MSFFPIKKKERKNQKILFSWQLEQKQAAFLLFLLSALDTDSISGAVSHLKNKIQQTRRKYQEDHKSSRFNVTELLTLEPRPDPHQPRNLPPDPILWSLKPKQALEAYSPIVMCHGFFVTALF